MTGRAAPALATGLGAAAIAALPLIVREAVGSPLGSPVPVLGIVAVLAVVDATSAFRDRPPDLPTPADERLATLSGLAVLAVVWLAIGLPGDASRLGLAIAAVGIGLRAAAITTLGPRFTTAIPPQPAASRVTTGPYRVLTHPGEIGLILALFGAAWAAGSLAAAIAVCLLILPTSWLRVRREDRAWTLPRGDVPPH